MKEHGLSSGKKLILSSIAVILVAGIVLCAINFFPWKQEDKKDKEPQSKVSTISTASNDIALGDGLVITSIDKHGNIPVGESKNNSETAIAVEIENRSGRTLRYAVINAVINGQQAAFEISTLPAGEKALVFEKNGIQVNDSLDYSDFHTKNVIYFEKEPSLYEDVFEITCYDGIINIRNISEKDINNTVYVYYKNYKDGMYQGGVTYRSGADGGIKAGEIRQLSANNYSLLDSKIMFVDYVQ